MTESPNLGRRICVVGTSGSGKTFVAEALAACLGISYICNGAIIWRANWVPTPHEERVVEMERLTGQDRWTFDGNLSLNPSHSPDQVALRNCDTIVWLDLPRWQVHTQMLFRTINRAITKEPMWHGNIEGWRQVLSNDSMIWWSVKTYRMRRREYSSLFSDPKFEDKTRIRLASRGEVTHWLRTISR